MRTVQTVGVVGAGAMGTGIALSYALSGRSVLLYCRTRSRTNAVTEQLNGSARRLAGLGYTNAIAARNRITATTDLTATAQADHVVEAIPENLDTKREVVAELDRLAAPDVLIASTTSTIPVTEIAAGCERPERVLAAHFYFPAHLMPLVDIVAGERTTPEAVAAMQELLAGIGKETEVVPDTPGTVGPRLQTALIGEGMRIVAEGLADPQTVDRIISGSIGRRLPVTGVFDRLDHAGLDTVAEAMRQQGRAVPPHLDTMIKDGHLGVKSGRGFYDWSDGRVEAAQEELERHLIGMMDSPPSDHAVMLDQSVPASFLERAREVYVSYTPERPRGCFALLIGQTNDDHYAVERVEFGRNARADDPQAVAEFDDTVVPCFGAAYDNPHRGFWCDSNDLLEIHRKAETDGLEVIGSIHLHPDWHRIGPASEQNLTISHRPTPMDRHMFRATGWPVNIICYLESRNGRFNHTIAAWSSLGTELPVRFALNPPPDID